MSNKYEPLVDSSSPGRSSVEQEEDNSARRTMGSKKLAAAKKTGDKKTTTQPADPNLLQPDDGDTKHDEKPLSLFKLFRFTTVGERLILLVGSVFAVIEGAGFAVLAVVFGGITNIQIAIQVNGFQNGTNPAPATNTTDYELLGPEEFESKMSTFALFYVFIGISVYLSSLIQVSCWQTVAERQTFRIRRTFFRSVLRQELAWFDKNQAGEIATKFNDDIERIRDGVGEQFSSTIKYASTFLSGFVLGFALSWRLTLVITAATPLLAIFSAYMGRMLATSTRREQEKYASAGALAEEAFVAIRTVLSLNGQRSEIKNYTKILNESKRMAIKKYIKLAFIVGLSLFVLYSTYGLALYVSTILRDNDLIEPGQAITVIMAVMMGANALGNVIPPLQTITMSLSSASLIYKVIDHKPLIDASTERGLKLSKVTANIKFENVTFSYPTRPQVPVIENLSFELNQGQTVAFVGKTGSGKSTVVNLLLRFYDPQQGAVYLDNCNLYDMNVAWLRSLVGIVEQEPALFDCTIYENIALGLTTKTDRIYDRVMEVAKLANAHEFIKNLPDGYNTRCGDRGVQMSGGQKQRIAIARALISDPKILLLDEATSALDSESEFIVQSALNRARQGRTTIIIAHRLSTIRDADLICVMDHGQLVESGKHEDLLEKKGFYHNLVMNQMFHEQQHSDKDLETDSAPELATMRTALANTSAQLVDEEQDSSDAPDLFRSTTSESRTPQVARSVSSTRTPYTTSDHQDSSNIRPITTTLYESVHGPSSKNLTEAQTVDERSVGRPSFKDFATLMKPELVLVGLGTFSAVLAGGIMPVFALFYAQIIDTLSKTGPELIASGIYWSLMFVVLATCNFVAMTLRIVMMAFAIERATSRIRVECFTNIIRQHIGWFDAQEHSPQRLSTRLASDVPQIKSVLNSRLVSLISGSSTILVALVISFYLGWQLAIVLVLALPILLYVGYTQMRLSRGDRVKQLANMENISRLMIEATEHVKLVQAINQERFFYEKFDQESKLPLKESLKSARKLGLVYGLSQSFIYFNYAAAFRWGAYLIAHQYMDPLTVFRIFFCIAFTAVAVGQWSGLGGDKDKADHAVALIIRLLSTRSAIDNLNRGGIKPVIKGRVTFQDVYFRYPSRPDSLVLQGLTLTIKPGQTLALVGPSGNGKSTLAALLLRFYDPDRGVVRIDNYNIRCINISHLRHNIGLVSQEPILFKASIKANILYGLDKSRYTMRDVVNAAKLANIDDFIQSLPNGYNTQVGERGTQMSGGQKQRIAIARTVIRNPTILILDEATSALDAESEALVSQALDKVSKGKTCIKIAHRLSTVRDADQIAVIERGLVVELGTHEELMAIGKEGHYYKLMQKQEFTGS